MPNSAKKTIFSVSALNQSVAQLLEDRFTWVRVEGELSNLAQPASGHLYFSLKDSRAQIRCAMFKGRNCRLTFPPKNGQQVLVRAKVSLYQPRGDYQLIVDRMDESGAGALQKQFELLKQKLATAGLFAAEHKRKLPLLPENIGLITSASGAALYDVLSVIKRRFPAIKVNFYAVPVQGKEAAPAICKALQQLAQHGDCEAILLVRGGGSLEDLWPFNEATVAQAIFNCPLPVVSGIGHEVDVTIADFVADIRTATPTAAAEAVTPDQQTWLQYFDQYQQRLERLIQENIQYRKEKMQWLSKRLKQQHPARIMQQARQNCTAIELRLNRAWQTLVGEKKAQRQQQHLLFMTHSPNTLLKQKQQTLQFQIQQLHSSMQQLFKQKKNQLSTTARTLQAISPLKTLSRGYSITFDINEAIITTAKQVEIGDTIETRLYQGSIISRVEKRR